MERIKTFRDLLTWQKSIDLVYSIYQVTKRFPLDELYGLTSQMRRSAISVPSNIAEGYGRRSTVDYKRFLKISTGSLYELQTQLEIAFRLTYMSKDDFLKVHEESREVERMLSSLIKKIV